MSSSTQHFTQLSPSEWRQLLGPSPKQSVPKLVQGEISKDDLMFHQLFTIMQDKSDNLRRDPTVLQSFLKKHENGLRPIILWIDKVLENPPSIHDLPGGASVLQYQAPVTESQLSLLLPQFRQLIEKAKESQCSRHIAAFNTAPENVCM